MIIPFFLSFFFFFLGEGGGAKGRGMNMCDPPMNRYF